RLIQTGLINPQALGRKYESELHANEIVLLAYYIASVNIENTYHSVMGEDKAYKPFGGICLTDTFQLGEGSDQFDECLPKNSERVKRQKNLPVRVIIGNPPYSVGQKSANDNAQNQKYEHLDARIEETYAAETTAILKNSLYDSYIKAFRWSSDRLDNEKGGIIAFVSNGSWLDGNALNGFRKCLEKEFSGIYVFNLRGNCRTQGELRRKEAGNVFGLGSRTPIAITVLVKNPKKAAEITINENGTKNYAYKAEIQYYQVPDYLSREEKLALCSKYGSIFSLPFKNITPDSHGDWLTQRSTVFESFIPLEPDKKFNKTSKSLFSLNVVGVCSSRDAFVYNFSKKQVESNVRKTINFYNEQREKYYTAHKIDPKLKAEDFVDLTSGKVIWTVNLKNYLTSNRI
ncbi:MAG: hypothetical protein K5838_05525, partial [Elusimicrobiales bacterium]|nr:hypothetical protein [Elusimicrobiales bacterium]